MRHRWPLVIACALVALLPGLAAEPQGRPARPRPTQLKPVRAVERAQPGPHYQSAEPRFWVRPGFRVTRVADNLRHARFLEIDPQGNLYLSRPNLGDVLLLRPQGGRYRPVGSFVLKYPRVHGLCWANGWLWFAQSGAIHRARDRNGDGRADQVATVLKGLPDGGGHWQRSLLVTADSIYTSIGDSGNITDETAGDRQKIWRYDLAGRNKRLFASGLRNTEKLRMRPGTSQIWGCDHGSDWFGRPLGDREGHQPITDLNPPEELNLYVQGGFYGHPFITGNRVPRVEYHRRPDLNQLAARTIPPAWSFGAHHAPNGFAFYTGTQFPPDCRGDLFVALHGSWNRQDPEGYRIERVLFDRVTGRPYGAQIVVGTLARDGRPLARPVDVVQAPDGSLLFSDDLTNSIYRLQWVGRR